MTAALFTTGAARILAPREARVGQKLPYLGHVDDHTVRTREGLLLQVIRLKGLAFETKTDEELSYRKALRETLLRGAATSRLAIYHHVIRRQVDVDLKGDNLDAFGQDLSRAWRGHLSERRLFVNDLYLTLVRRPLQGEWGFLERLVRPAAPAAGLASDLRQLHATREAFMAGLSAYGPETLGLKAGAHGRLSEPAAFIASLVNAQDRPVLAPSGDLGEAVATRRLNFGLDAMEFAATPGEKAKFGAIVSLKDYPAQSQPGMLDAVMRLPFELVLTESFAFVDRQVSLNRMGLALRRLRAADDDAISLRADLASARDEVGSGRSAYGEHHLAILVKAESLEALGGAVAEVQAALGETGAITVQEDVNLEPAFWAQFPGNFKYIARKALVSAANFSSLASLHGHPLGQSDNLHWGAPVTLLETTAFGPYHFNFHVGDLGNFTVIGPSGSGKTALINFLLAQAGRFRPKIILFDKDRGSEIFVRASGGRYDQLTPGEPSGLNPLMLRDTPENRAFLQEFLVTLVQSQAGLGPEERALIDDAVDALFDQPREHRRLRFVVDLLRGARRPTSGDLAARLSAWVGDGEHAWLFDNAEDRLDLDVALLGFDMTRILEAPLLRTPAMLYLFHRVEERLDGAPTMIVVDEGWKALDDQVFVRKIRDWQKTIRKRNGIVGFCTQSASDALDSQISSAIIEQSATQIFFPNPKAQAHEYMDGFGLSAHEFELVRTLPDTARCFLIKQADHSVIARLDLSGLPGFLKILAGTERTVRRLDALRATLGDEPQAWLDALLDETSGAIL